MLMPFCGEFTVYYYEYKRSTRAYDNEALRGERVNASSYRMSGMIYTSIPRHH